MIFYTLKVLGLRNETLDTRTIIFKQPGLKKISYLPGQYLTLIFRINGRRYSRPYSFSSAPVVDSNLEVTVKRVPRGIVSNHVIDNLNVGDIVEVMEPMGNFTLNDDLISTDTHIVLWGAGSGITPLMSIAKYVLYKKMAGHISLVYGNRNAEAVIFNNQIERLKVENDDFSVWHFHTYQTIVANSPYLIQGRIDPDKVLSVMRREGDFNNTVHYICGPLGLKESITTALFNLGVESERIFCEDFEIVRDTAAFEDVITRTVYINKGGNNSIVEVVKGKSILEAGLDAMIDLPYSCQTGNCLVCKGCLVKGRVKLIGIIDLPIELKDNECLLCCSFPMTDNVEIIVD